MNHDEREPCLTCPVPGACCYMEGWNPVTRERTATRTPCRFLDVKTGSCRVYQERHARAGNACLTIKEMLQAGTVPLECRHVIDQAAYAARPVKNTTLAEMETSRRVYTRSFWKVYWKNRGEN